MIEPQIVHRQGGLTTSEMVVYPMIAFLLVGVAFGLYHNSRIDAAVSAAVDLGLKQQVLIEEYFELYGEMPQSEADLEMNAFIPEGILTGLDYRAGEFGVPAADKQRTSTLRALVDMTEFGTRFENIESGFLLIARAQDDDTVKWACIADEVTVDALDKRYLPESCKGDEDEDADKADKKDKEEER